MKRFSANIYIITRLGTQKGLEPDINRRIAFSNIVFISLPVVYAIFMAIDYDSYLVPLNGLRFDQFIVPIVILICFSCLYLNYRNNTTLSRILFIGLWPLLMHILPIVLISTPSDYYLAYPFGLVFHSMLIQLMFSHKKERLPFISFILLNVVAMILAPSVLVYFDDDKDVPAEMINYKYYLLDIILYWLLFNLITFYILYIIEGFIQRLNTSKTLIENQKEELNKLNSSLEALVAKRTEALESQNEKLRQHAFFNAHLLRGPFCRIQGLIQLQELENPTEGSEIASKLKESINELDSRIHEIQRLVENDYKVN